MVEKKIIKRVYSILLVFYTLSLLRYNLQTNSKVVDTAVILETLMQNRNWQSD